MARKGGEVVPLRPRRRGPRIGRFLIFLIFFALLLGIVVFHTSVFTLQEIDIEGNMRLKDEDVIRLTALETGSNLFRIQLQQVEEWLQASPWVKKASIRRILPDRLSIVIEERQPSFLVPYYTSFLYVASDGTILSPAPTNIEGIMLPILTGLDIKDPALPGQSLYCQELANLVGALETFPEDFKEQIVEIHITEGGELVFYTGEGVQIHFGQATACSQKVALIKETMQELDGSLAVINVCSGNKVHVLLKDEVFTAEEDRAAGSGDE